MLFRLVCIIIMLENCLIVTARVLLLLYWLQCIQSPILTKITDQLAAGHTSLMQHRHHNKHASVINLLIIVIPETYLHSDEHTSNYVRINLSVIV